MKVHTVLALCAIAACTHLVHAGNLRGLQGDPSAPAADSAVAENAMVSANSTDDAGASSTGVSAAATDTAPPSGSDGVGASSSTGTETASSPTASSDTATPSTDSVAAPAAPPGADGNSTEASTAPGTAGMEAGETPPTGGAGGDVLTAGTETDGSGVMTATGGGIGQPIEIGPGGVPLVGGVPIPPPGCVGSGCPGFNELSVEPYQEPPAGVVVLPPSYTGMDLSGCLIPGGCGPCVGGC